MCEWGKESSRVKSVSHLGMFLRAELFSTQRRIVLKTAVGYDGSLCSLVLSGLVDLLIGAT